MDENEFPSNPEHLAIAMAYRNEVLIADQVLPRTRVGKRAFDWWKYDLSDGFRIPDTKVGKFDDVGRMRFKATKQDSSLENHALSEDVSLEDVNDADGYDPIAKATERVTDLVLLAREKRVADLVFNAATYPTANKDTLSGTDQWDNSSSHPIKKLKGYIDTMVQRPRKAVVGRAAWTVLSQHPDVLQPFYRANVSAGVATRQMVAELLEVQEVIVGEGWLDLSVKGQAASLTRVWDDKIALLYTNPLADANGGLTFGFTAWDMKRYVKSVKTENKGLDGVVQQIVGERVREIVACSDCGFLVSNVLST